MAERKAKEIKAILREIEKLDATTLRVASNVIRIVGMGDMDRLREELIKNVLPVAKAGADASAQLGAATYNRWRMQDIGQMTKAVASSAYDEGKFMSAINAAVKKAETGGTIDDMLSTMAGRVGYTSRTSYSRSLFQSGKADSKKPQYARVPEDEEACQFCMMLASNGFQYSKGSLGDDVHNHANCRCTYVCSWDDDPKAQGYDDGQWYDRWQESIDQEAEERAERNGTTVEEERKAIMQRYSDQATRSKQKEKAGGSNKQEEAQAPAPVRVEGPVEFESRIDADDFLRPFVDERWGEITAQEKEAILFYTEDSNPINVPIYAQTKMDNEAMEALENLTTAIEKYEMPVDYYAYRGTDARWLATQWEYSEDVDMTRDWFVGVIKEVQSGDADALQQLREELEDTYLNCRSFTSMGTTMETSYAENSPIVMRIGVPEGTKALYAEPQSFHGATIGKDNPTFYEPGMTKRGVGDEAEIILQRNSDIVINSVAFNSETGKIEIEAIVESQKGGFISGNEYLPRGV